jgi:hypothetical protein
MTKKSSRKRRAEGGAVPSKQGARESQLKPVDQVIYKSDHRRIEVVKIPDLREAFSRRKTAKITFEEFERMTGEVLDK